MSKADRRRLAALEPTLDNVVEALRLFDGQYLTPRILDALPGGRVEWRLNDVMDYTTLRDRRATISLALAPRGERFDWAAVMRQHAQLLQRAAEIEQSAQALRDRDAAIDLASRLLDMVERVEWVRASAGAHYVCAFCGGTTERDGGDGHLDDCAWQTATREGNELRLRRVLR